MKKLALLTAALLFAAVLSACGSFGDCNVLELEGDVQITHEKKDDSISAKTGMKLKNNDTVSSNSESMVWINLDRFKSTLLGEDTSLLLSHSDGGFKLDLKSGIILVRIEKALKTEETFDVRAGSFSVSVRGTVFIVQILDGGKARASVLSGKAAICDASGGELITIAKNTSVTFDTLTGELDGEPAGIDYPSIPKTIRDCLKDYEHPTVSSSSQEASLQAASSQEASSSSGTEIKASSQASESTDKKDNPQSVSSRQVSSAISSEQPTQSTVAEEPKTELSYMWSTQSDIFKPCLDISWSPKNCSEFYILWQYCDETGKEQPQSGRFDSANGKISITEEMLDISSANGIFKKGCAIRLTPCYRPTDAEQSSKAVEMKPIWLKLPYVELSAELSNGKTTPIVETNIGFFFDHAYNALTVEAQQYNAAKSAWEAVSLSSAASGERLRYHINGSLSPLKGYNTSIYIDVVSKEFR